MVTAMYYDKILVLGNLSEQKSRVALVSIVCYRFNSRLERFARKGAEDAR